MEEGMTTIVKFTYSEWPMRFGGYECNKLGGKMSGEYVPLAEYHKIFDDAVELAKQVEKLKALIQRVIDMNLTDSLKWSPVILGATEGYQSPELIQLLKDCQEAL